MQNPRRPAGARRAPGGGSDAGDRGHVAAAGDPGRDRPCRHGPRTRHRRHPGGSTGGSPAGHGGRVTRDGRTSDAVADHGAGRARDAGLAHGREGRAGHGRHVRHRSGHRRRSARAGCPGGDRRPGWRTDGGHRTRPAGPLRERAGRWRRSSRTSRRWRRCAAWLWRCWTACRAWTSWSTTVTANALHPGVVRTGFGRAIRDRCSGCWCCSCARSCDRRRRVPRPPPPGLVAGGGGRERRLLRGPQASAAVRCRARRGGRCASVAGEHGADRPPSRIDRLSRRRPAAPTQRAGVVATGRVARHENAPAHLHRGRPRSRAGDRVAHRAGASWLPPVRGDGRGRHVAIRHDRSGRPQGH